MTAQIEHRTLVERYIAAYVSGDTSYLPEIIAPDFVDRSFPQFGTGPAGIANAVALMQRAFSGLEVSLEQCLSQGDFVAFRMVISGTHVGEFNGKPATGNRLVFAAADFVRIRDGKFIELWSVQDSAALLLTVGAAQLI